MIKSIVVPLDGSPEAEAALEPARRLAVQFGAGLTLLTTTFAAEAQPSESYLADRAAELTDRGVDVETRVVVHRFAERGILEVVDETPEPAICMATHGRGAARTLLLGNVANEVVSHAVRPVVLVGPNCGHDDPNVRRILWCLDRSRLSATIEHTVTEWAKTLGLEIWLVAVRLPVDARGTEPPSRLHEELEAIAARLRKDGFVVHTNVLDSPDPAKVIVDLAKDVDATLIAASTHGQGGLASTGLGRVVSKIIRHSHCPVLVERPHL